MEVDRESEAYREAIEVMARDEHEYMEQFGTPGAVHPCPPAIHAVHVFNDDDCDGTWTESEYSAWEDEDEHIKEMHREDARRHLSALLAPSRVTCPTCGGHGYVDDDVVPCSECADGYIEGPPVIWRVLGMEQEPTDTRQSARRQPS